MLENIFQWIILVGTAGGILYTSIFGVAKPVYKMLKTIQEIKEENETRKEGTKILLKSLFAIMDGLGQMGIDGIVTDTRNNLEKFIIEKG